LRSVARLRSFPLLAAVSWRSGSLTASMGVIFVRRLIAQAAWLILVFG
jgi:hypothetical protein